MWMLIIHGSALYTAIYSKLPEICRGEKNTLEAKIENNGITAQIRRGSESLRK